MGPWSELSLLDAELAGLVRQEGALRLRLGQALEVLGRGGCFELGFSSRRRLAPLGLCDGVAIRTRAAGDVAFVVAGAARIGVEAGKGGVTQSAWLEHARRRTLKHLREEVSAALVAVRISGERECWPPVEQAMDAFHELERAVVSGKLGEPQAVEVIASEVEGAEGPWRATLESLRRWLAGEVQTSAGVAGSAQGEAPSAGRVELRFSMSRGLYDWWAWSRSLRFLCLSMWRAHRHLLGAEEAYGAPGATCSAFTAGAIRATGTAERVRWELGGRNQPCVVVEGQERVAA